jgi:translation initiation factor 1
MPSSRSTRLAYSTERRDRCARCGWPAGDCRCSTPGEETVSGRVVAVLRLERAGRGGKSVTVVDGLPRNRRFLRDLAVELKRACGTGGTVRESGVEIQGDHRDALRRLLAARGWTVKG